VQLCNAVAAYGSRLLDETHGCNFKVAAPIGGSTLHLPAAILFAAATAAAGRYCCYTPLHTLQLLTFPTLPVYGDMNGTDPTDSRRAAASQLTAPICTRLLAGLACCADPVRVRV
jgi:hypothetical protein